MFDDAEDGTRRADAECEGQRRRCGKPRTMSERAKREAQITQCVEECAGAALVARVVLVSLDASEFALCAPPRFRLRHAHLDVSLRLHLEMEPHFFFQF